MPDLTFYRDVNIRDVQPGDTFIHPDDPDGTFYVDERRTTLNELELLGYPAGRSTGKRISMAWSPDGDLPDVRLTPLPHEEVALIQLLDVTPMTDLVKIDADRVVGFSAELGDTGWRVMVLTLKPAGWAEPVTSRNGRVIDVDEARGGPEAAAAMLADIPLNDPLAVRLATH